jgi:uncharacterized protein
MRAFNRTSGKELAWNLSVAETAFSRAKGLLGRQALPLGEGLIILPCKGVHTFLMRFPIDVIFLDRNNHVIETIQNLKPFRISKMLLSSMSVIELPAGTVCASDTVIGNKIILIE